MTTKAVPGDRRTINRISFWLPVAVLAVLWGLGFRQLWLSDNAARDYALAVAVGLAVVTAAEVWIWYGTKLSYSARIALTALGFGCVMLFTMAPMAIADELAHYENTLRCLSVPFGRALPVSLFDYTGLSGHYNVSAGYLRVWQELFRTWPSGSETFLLSGGVAYFPEYVPQMIGAGIGLLLHCDFVTLFLLGRFTNLAFYCLCVYVALRRTPVYKELLGITALLPMALHQAASLSYDAFIVALSLLYIASLFYSREKAGCITRSELLWIAVPGVLLAPTRAVYIVLALLFLLIPKKRFPSSSRRLVCLVLLLGACACLTFGSQATTLSSLGEDRTNWDGGVTYTLSAVLADPLRAVRLFAVTFFRKAYHWVCQAHGTTLGGLTLTMPRWIACGFCILLLTAVWDTGPQGKPLVTRERSLGLFVVLCTVGGMMLAMLLAWTSLDCDEIQGVQGRYFLPVLPLGYWALSLKKPILRGRTAVLRAPAVLILLMSMVIFILNYTLTK